MSATCCLGASSTKKEYVEGRIALPAVQREIAPLPRATASKSARNSTPVVREKTPCEPLADTNRR